MPKALYLAAFAERKEQKMLKVKKISALFLVFTILCGLFTVSVSADAAVGNIVYTRDDATITATVSIDSTTLSRILVVRSYKKGIIKEIKTAKNAPDDTAISVSVRAGVDSVSACVVDENGKPLTTDAVYNADSLSLRYIKINGIAIPDYSDDVDKFYYQFSGGSYTLDAVPKDSTTKVTVTKNADNAVISLVSAFGHTRTVTVVFYTQESDRYKLLDLKYKIGDTEYEIPGFSSETYMYENIQLPDNTMSLTLIPKAIGNISIQTSNEAITEMDGVTLGKFVNSTEDRYSYPRYAVDNVIPLKNKMAIVSIEVTFGDNFKTYYFVFNTNKQPKLLEMNYVGASGDESKPTFVGGCSVYNDNGTLTTPDWGYAACFISKTLVGSSYIMMPGYNSETKTWWQNNSTGEYFNFKVDRDCTIYVLSAGNFSNTEWSDNGWSTANNGSTPTHTDGAFTDNASVAHKIRKDWNDYSSPSVYAGVMKYSSADSKAIRCLDPGVKETDKLGSTTFRNMKYARSKHFSAGDEIKIYHTGDKNKEGGVLSLVVIKWDNDDNSLLYGEKVSETSENPTITDPLEDSSIGYDNALIMDLDTSSYDAENGKWLDKSGLGNDMTLGIDENNYWTESGFKVTAVNGGAKTDFPEAILEKLQSGNATLQFKLSSFTNTQESYSVILSNNATTYMLRTSDKSASPDISNANLRFNVGGSTKYASVSGIDISEMNTIVFDKNSGKLYWYVGDTQVVDKSISYPAGLSSIAGVNLSYTGSSADYLGSSVTFDTIKAYNRALSPAEVAGSLVADTGASDANLEVSCDVSEDIVTVMALGKKDDGSNYTMSDVMAAVGNNDFETLKKAVISFEQAESENGKINIDLPVPKTLAVGDYLVYVNGSEFTVSYENDKQSKAASILSNIDDIKYFSDSAAYNSLSNQTNVKSYVTELLAGEVLSANAESVEKIENAVKLAVVIEKLNENKTTTIAEIKEVADLFAPAVPMTKLSMITEAGKRNIVSSLSGKNFTSVDEYQLALAQEMFINAVNLETGISNDFEKVQFFGNFASAVGINLNTAGFASVNATTAVRRLAAKNTRRIADMQSELKQICDELKRTGNSAAAGGGGGGGADDSGAGGAALGGVPVTNGYSSAAVGNSAGGVLTSSFTDMGSYSWANNAVQTLLAKGIISGYADMTYKPQKSVTRAEFITMMVKAYMPNAETAENDFSDIAPSDWYYNSVMTAFSKGIISGVTTHEFMPNNQIKRQDIAVILYNLASKFGKVSDSVGAEFVDGDEISNYAKAAVSFLKSTGVVKGDESGAFKPQSYANRAEAAQMIYTFMEFIGEEVLK